MVPVCLILSCVLRLPSSAQETDDAAAIVRRLGSDSPHERDAAEARLKRIGDPAIPALENGAADPNGEIAARSKRALQAIVAPDFSKRALAKLPGGERGIFGLSFSPDGKTLAGATGDACTLTWDVGTGRALATYGTQTIDVASFFALYSPDGRFLAARSGLGQKTSIWDLARGTELVRFQTDSSDKAAAMSPDGTILATGGRGAVHLWETSTGSKLAALSQPGGPRALAFSADGKRLLSAAHAREAAVIVWDVAGRAPLLSLSSIEPVTAAAWGPSESVVVVGDERGVLTFRDAAKGADLGGMSEDRHVVSCLAYSPRGNLLASCGSDGWIRLWSVARRKSVARFGPGKGWIRALAFSPDGATLATSDGTLWNVADIAAK